MAVNQARRQQVTALETCADAASEMRTTLDELEDVPAVYEETDALLRQLERIETACSEAASLDGDPKDVARKLIDQIPLRAVFRDKALADAFLSELFLSLARESSHESRREQLQKGIDEARAQGVRFGAPLKPLPENFEEVRRAWRSGQISGIAAAQLCGMPKTSFYNAVRRVEKTV